MTLIDASLPLPNDWQSASGNHSSHPCSRGAERESGKFARLALIIVTGDLVSSTASNNKSGGGSELWHALSFNIL